MSGNEQIKIQKTVLNQVSKDTRLNKILKLVSRFSKAITDILKRGFMLRAVMLCFI